MANSWEELKTQAGKEGAKKPKPLFTSADIAKVVEQNKNTIVKSNICAAFYGVDGTGKTGAAVDCRTPEEIKEGWKVYVVDFDDGCAPLKYKYYDNDENLILLDPTYIGEDNKPDYVATYDKTLAIIKYILEQEAAGEKIKAIVLDGLDSLLKTCVPGDTILYTPSGIKLIKDVTIGDKVLTMNGDELKYSVVTDTLKTTTEHYIKVTLQNNLQFKMTPNHRMPILRKEPGKWWTEQQKIVLAKELCVDDYLAIPLGEKELPHQSLTTKESKLIGYMISEGSMRDPNSPTFSNTDGNIIKDFKNALSGYPELTLHKTSTEPVYLVSKEGKHGGKPNRFKTMLKEVGLWNTTSFTKFVPDDIKYGALEQIEACLVGLWNGDGSFSARFDEYFTMSEQLAKDVQFLLWRIGMVSKVTPSQGGYSVQITKTSSRNILREMFNKATIPTNRNPSMVRDGKQYIKIKSITEESGGEAYDITVPETGVFVANQLLSGNCEYVMKIEDLKINPQAQITQSFEWGKRNSKYYTILLLLKRLKCHKFYITHMKDLKKWTIVPGSGDRELSTVGTKPNWQEQTPNMMFQKVLFTREDSSGKVVLKAKIEKCKTNIALEGKEVVVAEITKDKAKWNGLQDLINQM